MLIHCTLPARASASPHAPSPCFCFIARSLPVLLLHRTLTACASTPHSDILKGKQQLLPATLYTRAHSHTHTNTHTHIHTHGHMRTLTPIQVSNFDYKQCCADTQALLTLINTLDYKQCCTDTQALLTLINTLEYKQCCTGTQALLTPKLTPKCKHSRTDTQAFLTLINKHSCIQAMLHRHTSTPDTYKHS